MTLSKAAYRSVMPFAAAMVHWNSALLNIEEVSTTRMTSLADRHFSA